MKLVLVRLFVTHYTKNGYIDHHQLYRYLWVLYYESGSLCNNVVKQKITSSCESN